MATNESKPAESCCCLELACSSSIFHRDDIARHELAQRRNVWCAACGRFWEISPEELADVVRREEDWMAQEDRAERLEDIKTKMFGRCHYLVGSPKRIQWIQEREHKWSRFMEDNPDFLGELKD
jgi:hypothetical protein